MRIGVKHYEPTRNYRQSIKGEQMAKVNFEKAIKILESGKRDKQSIYFTMVNQYNYCINQLKVDHKNKSYAKGSFTTNENVVARPVFNDVIDYLDRLGYQEITK